MAHIHTLTHTLAQILFKAPLKVCVFVLFFVRLPHSNFMHRNYREYFIYAKRVAALLSQSHLCTLCAEMSQAHGQADARVQSSVFAATICNVYGSPTMLLLLLLLLLQLRVVIAVSRISLVFARQSIFTIHWTRFSVFASVFSASCRCFYNRQISCFLFSRPIFEFSSNCA